MKAIKYIAVSFAALCLAACSNDMDRVYMSPEEPVSLGGATQDVVLSEETPQALALTIYWSGDGRIQLSDDRLQAPVNAAELTIQLADNERFLNSTEVNVEKGQYMYQFFSEDFNKLLTGMGYAPGVSMPLWIRVRSTLASNIAPLLSNALKVNVTPYEQSSSTDLLYFSGLVTWDGFDDYLTLYDKSTKSYGGAHWIDSEWGYRVYTEPDWSAAYKAAEGAEAMSGSLVFADSDGNVPAPEKGLYVMDFNMNDLTYKLTKVESVSFTGVNDDWSVRPMTQSAANPEVFTAEFEKTAETPWGVKVLINESWSLFFGRGDNQGTLYLGFTDATSGFEGDNEFEIGQTLVLTVDLGKQTYTYSVK